jgi:hypothetical protein
MVAQAAVVVNNLGNFFWQEFMVPWRMEKVTRREVAKDLKIGIISDTHGSALAWDEASKYFQGSQLVLHGGDVLYHGPRNPLPQGHGPMRLVELLNASPWPVVISQGNCDAQIDLELLSWPVNQPYALVKIEGLKILLSHGHLGEVQLERWAQKFGAQLVVSGHTHQYKLMERGGVVFLNPGSPSLPKGGPPSIAVVEAGVAKIISLEDGSTLAMLALGS